MKVKLNLRKEKWHAFYDSHRSHCIKSTIPTADLQSLWQEAAQTIDGALEKKSARIAASAFEPQFLVLITCRDEVHQTELLERFQKEGLTCKVLLS